MYSTSAKLLPDIMPANDDIIDLRSDTVTRPTAAMREAMASAVVGDDVYGDDPTVAALEEKTAKLLGKEAGLFVSSGTQSNLIALLSHCGRGEEYISGSSYHLIHYEAGGASVLGGISPCQLPVGERGNLTVEGVKEAIKPDDIHHPISRLVSLENTVYGLVQDQANLDDIADLAHDNGLKAHLDGARLMNAVIKSNATPHELVERMDTVSLCLSKGLGAPVGSVLVGPEDFIHRARRNRKLLGGGTRQAGFLAAAGIYALDHHINRLAEDHQRAHDLGEILSSFVELNVHTDRLETNMIFFSPEKPDEFHAFMYKHGILFSGPAKTMRLVTHLDIDDNALSRIKSKLDIYFSAR